MASDLPPVDWRSLLETLYGVVVAAAHPKLCLPENLPDPGDYKKIYVIAVGKAAASSAAVIESVWQGHDIGGVAISPHVGGITCQHIELIEAAHPVADGRSIHAATKALNIAKSANEDDLLLILLSGGASSVMCLPADNVSLEEKQKVTSNLLKSGATIREINTVRKHLSSIKGGQLALAGANAKKILTLAISDVVGDDPSVIGSGPSYFDETSLEDAKHILAKYKIDDELEFAETLKADHPVFQKSEYKLIANAQVAINTAANLGRNMGFVPTILGANQAGDAEFMGKTQARFIEKLFNRGRNKPKLFLAGGEYTTIVKGKGQGGPNQHFLLSLLHHLPEDLPLYALSADTDGQDGTGTAAGAWITPETYAKAKSAGLDRRAYLDNSDSLGFFSKLGNIIHAQATHTNVNDFRAFLIPPIN